MNPIEQFEVEFRAAVAAGEYGQAQRHWTHYAAQLQVALATPAAASRLAEAARLLEWTRHTALADRTRALEQIHQSELRVRYAGFPPEPPRTLRLVG
jgi:hypothetical protein